MSAFSRQVFFEDEREGEVCGADYSFAVIGTVDDVIKLSCILMRRRRPAKKGEILDFECCVSDGQARW